MDRYKWYFKDYSLMYFLAGIKKLTLNINHQKVRLKKQFAEQNCVVMTDSSNLKGEISIAN